MTDNINITGKLNSPPSTILRYGIAILTVVLVLGVKLLLEQFYDIKSPFLLFFTGVIISALFGGIRAGIFATILSAIISDYLFLSPSQLFFGEQSISQNIRLILFILEGVFISKIIDRLMSVNQEVLLRQQALQESQARYRSLIESVQDYAIFLLDVKGLVISWNQGAQNLKGYAAKEIIGQHFSCFYPQEDADRGNPDRYLQIAAVEGYIENEGWRIRKDGTRFWANAIITALRDEKGNLTGFCKLTRNLSEHRKTESETSSVIPESPEQVYSELEFRVQERTAQLTAINIELQQQIEERRKAEVALKQSEQRFRAIFNQTFQFIGLMQPNGILIEANETALKFGGLKREDAIDRPFWETRWWTLSPETQERLKQAIKEAANNQFIRYEVEVLGAGDTVRTIDFSIKPICDESGKVVLLIPEGRDISERKQAEAKIYQLNAELEQRVQQRTAQLEIEIAQQKQVQEALMQSEQRFRAAVDNIPDTFVIYDAERRLQFVNAEGLRRTQMPLKAFLGRRDEEIHPPEVTNGYLPYLLRTVETLTTQTFECTITLANYGTYTVIITYVPLLNEQGELYQILGITHDITQRKRAEEALRLSLERFRIALENSPIAVFNQDRELRYTWIYNPRLGYKAEEVLGKTDAELMHPEDAAKLTEIKQKVLLTGNGVREEVQASKIGEFSYYDLTVEPLQDDRGEIVGITAAAIDITDRKRTEAQLRIRAQQQAAIASLGQKALSGINLDELMKETTSLSAQILKVEYCEILELLPEKQQMIMRSAYGLPEELIGQSIVSTGLQSQAGYTLHASEPLIVSDLAAETRFTPSRFCQEYQIISGLSTIIAGVPQPFGVLQVHTTSKYSFTQDDKLLII
ncbi:PAS domain S-box protein [Floridanema evergladense]|uniref:PAS domain S-box protein n=1 Tax=Floridaenema evergladense BLCC-F167 TaxID=3153639 RepID=A0ABV4WK44_9CYAN